MTQYMIPSSPNRQTTPISIAEIESGLDFLLSHFSNPLFPRKISTYESHGKQFLVDNRDEAITKFIDSHNVDSRINAFSFSLLDMGLNWTPNLIFIDLDLNDFKDQKALDGVLAKTLRNIRKQIDDQAAPTVLGSGGGYHIIQPVDCPIVLEYVKEFEDVTSPSKQLLRFYKEYLSNNKADRNHNPSFKSCLLRIPNSINSKNNSKVKIIQKWNEYKPRIPIELLYEFRRSLITKKIEDYNKLRYHSTNENHISPINSEYYKWIDRLLEVGIEDCRKLTIDLIVVPYLILVKKLGDTETTNKSKKWLELCNNVRRLDDSRQFNHRIQYAIESTRKKQIPPMSPTTIKSENRYQRLCTIFSSKVWN